MELASDVFRSGTNRKRQDNAIGRRYDDHVLSLCEEWNAKTHPSQSPKNPMMAFAFMSRVNRSV